MLKDPLDLHVDYQAWCLSSLGPRCEFQECTARVPSTARAKAAVEHGARARRAPRRAWRLRSLRAAAPRAVWRRQALQPRAAPSCSLSRHPAARQPSIQEQRQPSIPEQRARRPAAGACRCGEGGEGRGVTREAGRSCSSAPVSATHKVERSFARATGVGERWRLARSSSEPTQPWKQDVGRRVRRGGLWRG